MAAPLATVTTYTTRNSCDVNQEYDGVTSKRQFVPGIFIIIAKVTAVFPKSPDFRAMAGSLVESEN